MCAAASLSSRVLLRYEHERLAYLRPSIRVTTSRLANQVRRSVPRRVESSNLACRSGATNRSMIDTFPTINDNCTCILSVQTTEVCMLASMLCPCQK